MARLYDLVWAQGEELTLEVTVFEGGQPLVLTNYQARMDVRTLDSSRTLLAVFNSDDISDTDPETAGSQPDTTHEITMTPNGIIRVVGNRSYTLPGGTIYTHLNGAETKFKYDLAIRDIIQGVTHQLLSGVIYLRRSATLWT